jgi:glutaredoxin 3
MTDVTIYSSMMCGFCHRAKQLLKKKGVAYNEIDVLFHPGRKEEMMRRAQGRHTVPQIFINDRHVGGCDELYALEREGKLDEMLREGTA